MGHSYRMRVLLVEPDPMIGAGLIQALKPAGMWVDWVRTGRQAKAAAQDRCYQVILLDTGLPDIAGLDVLADMRQADLEARIILTTVNDTLEDRLRGLDQGADDYLLKPFHLADLVARIQAVTRNRCEGIYARVEAGPMTLDLESRQIDYRGKRWPLKPREFIVMRALMERPGIVSSRVRLRARLVDAGFKADRATIDGLIRSLRRTFGQQVIRNVRGVGWLIGDVS